MKTKIALISLVAVLSSSQAFAEGWGGIIPRPEDKTEDHVTHSTRPSATPKKRNWLQLLIFGELASRYGIVPADQAQAELLAARLNKKSTAQLERDLQALRGGADVLVETANATGTAPTTNWPTGTLSGRKGTTGSPAKLRSEDIGQVIL